MVDAAKGAFVHATVHARLALTKSKISGEKTADEPT
jgi:hypothetical protein